MANITTVELYSSVSTCTIKLNTTFEKNNMVFFLVHFVLLGTEWFN